jgi:hypothetical protein
MTITVGLKGRLGNQLFQYATLRNVSIKTGFPFYIDTTFEWHEQSNLLKYFNIKESSSLDYIVYQYSQPNGSYYFDDNIFNIKDNTILDGHFENVKYFQENEKIIKYELTVKDETIIKNNNSFINDIYKDSSKIVGIHFRRGDVVEPVDEDEFNNKMKDFVIKTLEEISETEENITLVLFTGGSRLKTGGRKYSHENDLL